MTDLIDPSDGNRSTVPALSRGLRILELLGENPGGLTFREIGEKLNIPGASLSRLLKELGQSRYVTLSPSSGRYVLGVKLFSLGYAVLEARPVVQLSEHVLNQLAHTTGETAELWLPDSLATILARRVEVSSSFRLPQQAQPGIRDFRNHCKAPGKLHLALACQELLQHYIERIGLNSFGPNTITDEDQLLAELAAIRRQGYAIDREENRAGACRISAPIFNAKGEPEAFLTILGPAYRLTPEKDDWFAQIVVDHAEGVSKQLGWSGPRSGLAQAR